MGRPRKVVVEEEEESIVEDNIEPTLDIEPLNSEQATEPIKEEIIEENEDISINDSLEVNSSELEDTEEPKTLENNDNKEYINFTNESMSNLDADPTEIKKKKIKVKKKNINDIYTGMNFTKENYDRLGVLSIDHFIPWSFVKNDKIWNLVPTCSKLFFRSTSATQIKKLRTEARNTII